MVDIINSQRSKIYPYAQNISDNSFVQRAFIKGKNERNTQFKESYQSYKEWLGYWLTKFMS